jgi:hypothetical protein
MEQVAEGEEFNVKVCSKYKREDKESMKLK